jgi:hypothetical protein
MSTTLLQHRYTTIATKNPKKKQEAGPSHQRLPWPWVERRLAASELRGPRRRPGMRLHRQGGLHPSDLVTQLDRRTGATPPAPAWGRCVRDCASAGRPRRLECSGEQGLGRGEVWETCGAASRTRSSRRSSLGPSPPEAASSDLARSSRRSSLWPPP